MHPDRFNACVQRGGGSYEASVLVEMDTLEDPCLIPLFSAGSILAI